MKNNKEWRVWSLFWRSPKSKKWDDFETEVEAQEAAERLNASPSGKYTDYFVARKTT